MVVAFLHNVADHGHSPPGFDLFPPVRVYGAPHLHMDRIHLWGWFTGLGPSCGLDQDWDQDQAVDGLAGTLGWVPSCVGRVVLGPSLGANCGESMGMGVEEPGVSSHSVTMPSAKKRVRSGAM